jgi:hypothetical protein
MPFLDKRSPLVASFEFLLMLFTLRLLCVLFLINLNLVFCAGLKAE